MAGWLFYSLLALILWGLWGVFSKIAATHLPSWAIFLVEICVYLLVGGFIWALLRTPVTWTFPGAAAAVAAGFIRRVCPVFLSQGLIDRTGSYCGASDVFISGNYRLVRNNFFAGRSQPASSVRDLNGFCGCLAFVTIKISLVV